MSHAERYHGPLRAAFDKIRNVENLLDEKALEKSVKAVNDTVNPEGLIPTLLVYGSYPRNITNFPAESQVERMRAIDEARKYIQKVYGISKVNFGLKRIVAPVPGGQSDIKELWREMIFMYIVLSRKNGYHVTLCNLKFEGDCDCSK
jgi:hypothetical protein